MLKDIEHAHKLADDHDLEGSNGVAAAKREHAEPRKEPASHAESPSPADVTADQEARPVLVLFCYEDPHSVLGRRVANLARALAKRGIAVQIFARRDFDLEACGVITHPMGECDSDDLIASVQEFASRACNAFLKIAQDRPDSMTLMGFEWSAIPAMSLLRCLKTVKFILCLHSVERQRTDMTSEISRQIEEIELSGLREARDLLIEDPATAAAVRSLVPDCAGRIIAMDPVFPIDDFDSKLDPGAVKARYQVGPVDPMVLFVGDLNERYGPDMLIKSLPPVLKNHGQVRVVVVGEGDLYWPLRVFTRYLLLEHAVRLVGSVEGQALRELIQAADMVVIPSRSSVPWWPIQAAWAARRPVVATHPAAPDLLVHERDAILFYPSENSCVWGIERVLYDPDLGKALGEQGYAKLDERFGWGYMAALVAERMTASAAC